MNAAPALLHYAASETDADMYYATGFLAPDAFAWFRAGGRDHLLASDLDPEELLLALKLIEHGFGRRSGRRWGARVIDLDIILWSEGPWDGPGPIVPHPEFRRRGFVLDPLAEIAPDWRDPVSGATVRQLRARLGRPTPVDPEGARA